MMNVHRFVGLEDVGYTFPGPLLSSMLKVYGHSRCWFTGYGGLCNRYAEASSFNMHEDNWLIIATDKETGCVS